MPSPMQDRDYLQAAAERQRQTQEPIPIYDEEDRATIEAASKEIDYTSDEAIKNTSAILMSGSSEQKKWLRQNHPQAIEAAVAKDISTYETQWRDFVSTSPIRNNQGLELLSAADKAGSLDAVRESAPDVVEAYESLKNMGWSPDKTIPAKESAVWKGLKAAGRFVVDAVKGKHEDYDEVLYDVAKYVDMDYGTPNQFVQMVRQAADTKIDVPPAFKTIRHAGYDKFQNPLYTVDEDIVGNLKWLGAENEVRVQAGDLFYANKPGASIHDIQSVKRALPEIAIAGAAAPAGALWTVLTGMGAAAANTASRMASIESKAPSGKPTGQVAQEIGVQAVKEAALSGAFDVATFGLARAGRGAMSLLDDLIQGKLPALRNALGKAGAGPEDIPRFINDRGNITPEGMEFLDSKGISQDDLLPQVFDELLEISKNPKMYELPEQYQLAVARATHQDPMLAEVVSKLDPAHQKMLEAQGALLSNGSELGMIARKRVQNNADELKKLADEYSGTPTIRDIHEVESVYPALAAVQKDELDKASRLYGIAIDRTVERGGGQTPIAADDILTALDTVRKNYAGDDKLAKHINDIETELYNFGATSKTSHQESDLVRKLQTFDERANISRRRIELTTPDPEKLAEKIRRFEDINTRRRALQKDIHQRNVEKSRQFQQFNVEAAARLYRKLNSLKPPDKNFGPVAEVKKSIMSAIKGSTANDPTAKAFVMANNNYAKVMDRWAARNLVAELAARQKNSTASIPEIASSQVINKLKTSGIESLTHLMDTVRRSKFVGSESARVDAHLVEKTLRQNVWANLWNDFHKAGDIADAFTKENFEATVKAWGRGDYTQGLKHLEVILNQEQYRFLKTTEQLLDSQLRKPINSTSRDGTLGFWSNLKKRISDSTWLATKTPAVAAAVGAFRFGSAAKEQALERVASRNILYPGDVMEARLRSFMDDPVQYQAMKEYGTAATQREGISQMQRGLGQDKPYKKLTLEEKEAFHEAYKNTYPHLYEWSARQMKRGAAKKVVSVSAREATTGENNASQ